MSKPRNRVQDLEGIKGITSILIVYFHIWALCGFTGFSAVLNAVVSNFDSGVRLFFMLSAFGLLSGYEERLFESEESIKNFYIKRFCKLAPMFYVVMLIQMTINYFYNVHYTGTQLAITSSLLFDLLPGNQEMIVVGSWAVGIEWLFYIAFPLFLVIVKSQYMFIIASLGSLIITLGYGSIINNLEYPNTHINILIYLSYFFAGALVYKFVPFLERIKKKYDGILKYIRFPFLLCTLALSIFLTKIVSRDLGMLVGFALVIGFAVLGYSRIINNRLTRFIGRISYSIYLVHALIIQLFDKVGIIDFLRSYINNQYIAYFFTGVTIVVVTGIISYFTTKYIEEYLGKKMIYFFTRKQKGKSNKVSRME